MGQVKDETGKQYGYLTVIERAQNDKDGRAMWKCRCRCGNEVIVLGKHLRSGNTKSCGCYQRQRATESNLERGGDLTGKRFGKLTVLYENGFKYDSYSKRRRLWHCKCDCGNECDVQHVYLACGDTNSCGCINSVGNVTVSRWLTKNHIAFEPEYSFSDLLTENGYKQRFDFAILDRNNQLLCLIEYQGDIHFKYRENSWNNETAFKNRQMRDAQKQQYCKEKNIKLYTINYFDDVEKDWRIL